MVTTVTSAPPPPASAAHRTAEAAVLPRPAHTLASALAFLLGACVLAAAFDPNLSRGAQTLLFWSGLAVSLTAAVTVGLRRGARESQRVGALAGFGVLLYLPYLLRSPEHAIFGEELTQGRSVRLLAESGHTPAHFPGLDFVTLWLHDTTGIGLDSLARVVPLAVQTTVPLLVFGIATAIGLSGRTGFLAALVFLANPATFFIHSAFIPETLGILLFLAAWALVSACARDEHATTACVPGIVACLAGIVVVDHMSALVTALSFVVLALVTGVMRHRAVEEAVTLAAVSIVLLNGWLLLHATNAGERLTAAFAARVDELVDTVRQQAEMRGELLGTQTLPLPERLVGYVYPAVLLLLCLAGMFLFLRRWQALAPGPLLVALVILGPGLWMASVPAVIGGASEVASRASPFLFLGVALCAGLGARVLDGLHTVPRNARRAAVVGVLGVVIAGGIVVGDNVGGRFPRPTPSSAAGPESVTDAPIAAARWLLQTTGRDHPLVGDLGSALIFGTLGEQQPLSGNIALPFVARTPGQIDHELVRLGASYVVIDRRITLLPPRFGYYFGPEELAGSHRSLYGQPFPVAQLDKLNGVKSLSLMYDNGTTAVYGPAAGVLKPPRGP
jgi:hypothetical protein